VVSGGRFNQRVPIKGPTEVRAVADAFNRMADEVQSEQQAQQEFLANVSHDLKTPLTSIQGYSQAIIDGAANNPVAAATIIYDEAARLNRMVIELTDLARLQAGRLSMQMTGLDMGQLAEAIAQRLSIVAREKGIDLRLETMPMPEIAGDGDRLAQVLTNLISNAINYTPEGGMVTVRTQVANNGVEVSVEDTGVGIHPSELPRIFERFYQVDKARGPRRGTGLGLAIVQEIVQAHGGRIRASSPGENRGSTFTIWLPSPNLTTIMRRR
jgi:signal transduction histidine kinase